MPPALAADAKIPCPTPHHLKEELETLIWALEPEEKEDTWEKFERAIIRFSAVTRGGAYKHTDQYVEGIGRGGIGKKLVKCMLSDRGRLSGVTTDLLQTFAPRLSLNFKPLVNLYLEPLIDLLGRPNKVFLKRAEKCLATIVTNCQLVTILPELRRGLNDNATTCRRGSALGVERAVKEWSIEIWTEKYLVLLEESVKKMAVDKDPEVRQTGRRVWASFMEYWPERVEDFSAPLTPTIRRYLDMPAASAAGPSKPRPKAPVRIAAQSIQPISATSSESSHGTTATSSAAAHSRPQHQRINALASRPIRPIQHHAVPPAVEAGPSRRRSPRKQPEPSPVAPEEEVADTVPHHPTISRSVSSSHRNLAELAGPPALGRHGRSASHQVLPSSSATTFPLQEEHAYNPLSKPSRPALHPSHSAPPESFEIHHPPRRFAPPTRIIRVIPSEEEGGMEIGDHPFTTPSGATVLRGPQRNPNGGLGRRANPLGQAHRRVVTAPSTIAEDGYFSVKTPGRALGGLGGKRDTEADQENDTNSPIKEQHAIGSRLPPQTFASPIPTQVISMDSPLLPILIRSNSGDVRAEEDDSDIINMKEDVYPASPLKQTDENERSILDVARTTELPDSPVKEVRPLEEESEDTLDVNKNAVDGVPIEAVQDGILAEEPVEIRENELEKEAQEELEVKIAELAQPATSDADYSENVGIQEDSTKTTAANQQENNQPTVLAKEPSPAKKPTTVNRVVSAKAPAEVVKSAAVPTKPKVVGANTRKPPVPSAHSAGARTVSAPVVRKAFKPTSLTAPTAASASRAAAISKVAPATTAVSKPSVATSTVAKVPATTMTATTKTSSLSTSTSNKPSNAPLPRARVVSAQIASKAEPKHEPKVSTKPPLPPLARAAPTRVVSGPKKPAVTSHITLPPVKKEKVVRKAPLPSFRPTRGVTANSGTTSLKASTSSTVSSGRAKVKPEMIQLPESPATAKPTEVPLPPSPHEIPLPHSPLGSRAPSVLSTHSRNALIPSPLKVEIRARVRQDSIISAPQSPIRMVSIKPVSPLLTTVESSDQQTLSIPPAFVLPSQSDKAKVDGSLSSDPFAMTTSATPVSKALTDTTVDLGDVSIESNDTTLAKVSFKALSTNANANSPSKLIKSEAENENNDIASPCKSNSNSKPAFGSRSDVSTPSNKAAALLAKLEGSEKGMNLAMSFTPSNVERKALTVKDTNTPAKALGHLNGVENDWDVSA
ncbi:uncharacterized protein L201_005815 [Kwoniella dendrophila CBS 6074]|uniref:CLASP N-terminal domain-containing protein n=1 Tax=Kwoniella dendrophila CBS 6074 TaxID=1295534 RepID=A0AAX4K157_9TREE